MFDDDDDDYDDDDDDDVTLYPTFFSLVTGAPTYQPPQCLKRFFHSQAGIDAYTAL
jgi:hypothetical protein